MACGREFDFYRHVYEILRERTPSGFIPYYEVYSYLGRRFCLKKWQVKDLIKSMEGRGYLKMKKRGVLLIPFQFCVNESEKRASE